MLSTPIIVATLVYAVIGVVVLTLGFILWDRMTPVDLWREISEKQNVALAILAGAFAIGISIVVASAIHG